MKRKMKKKKNPSETERKNKSFDRMIDQKTKQ